MSWLRRGYPTVSLSESPLTLSFCLIFEIIEYTCAVLNIVFPLAYELIAARPHFGASSFHFTILKLTFVFGLVGPGHNSFPFHIIVFEFSLIESTGISKVVLSNSMKLAIYEISFVITALEFKSTFSCFLAFYEFSSEFNFVVIP